MLGGGRLDVYGSGDLEDGAVVEGGGLERATRLIGWFERGDRVAAAVDGRFTAGTGNEKQLPEFGGAVERSMVEGWGGDEMGCWCLVRGRRVVCNFFEVCLERGGRVWTS